MTVLLAAVVIVLAVIAILHLAWGLKVRWPVADETRLAATVIGVRGYTHMPPLAPSAAVAAALAAVIALALWHAAAPGWLPRLGMLGAATVFLARGVAAWTPAWRRLTPQQPFARLDQTIYGPLCLALALGLAVLALGDAA
jgi:hypothetical protein